MNALTVGINKSKIVELVNQLDEPFLILDDGDTIEQLRPPAEDFTVLDVYEDFYALLDGITHKRAKEFARTIYSSPDASQGENTLTVRNGRRALTRKLKRAETKRLDKLHFNLKDASEYEAAETLKDVLESPVLQSFLARPAGHTSFSLKRTILAKLDRTVLSDDEAFIIGNVLMSAFQGQIVVPDFGFYGRAFHMSLIRQNRLIAGVNVLDESPLKQHLLLMPKKYGSKCIAEDAEELARYSGLRRDPLRDDCEYNQYVRKCMA